MNLEEASWIQAEQELLRTHVAVIPVGAIENYGPHLALGTEMFLVEEMARRLGQKVSIIVTPVIPISCSQGHQGFPGTLSVTQAALKAYLAGICDSLIQQGISKILFLDGHGGNVMTLDEIGQDLMERGILCAQIDLWRFVFRVCPEDASRGQSATGHAGGIPTSLMLAIREDLVQRERFAEVLPLPNLTSLFPEITCYPLKRWSQSGVMGDPKDASKTRGEEMMARCVERLAKFVLEWN